MKIQILSDLHLEFAEFVPPHTGADVVVLAAARVPDPRIERAR